MGIPTDVHRWGSTPPGTTTDTASQPGPRAGSTRYPLFCRRCRRRSTRYQQGANGSVPGESWCTGGTLQAAMRDDNFPPLRTCRKVAPTRLRKAIADFGEALRLDPKLTEHIDSDPWRTEPWVTMPRRIRTNGRFPTLVSELGWKGKRTKGSQSIRGSSWRGIQGGRRDLRGLKLVFVQESGDTSFLFGTKFAKLRGRVYLPRRGRISKPRVAQRTLGWG